jgi:hypothetical protein
MFSAIWRCNDYDLFVTVISYLGFKDGEHWFLVESDELEGRTGVPASQLYRI